MADITLFSRADIDRGVDDFYREHGYIIIRDALTREEIDEIHRETVSLCRGEFKEVHGYAPPPAEAPDDDVLHGVLCLHHPHRASERFLELLAQPRIIDVDGAR